MDPRLSGISSSVTASGLVFTAGLVSPAVLAGETRDFAGQVDDVLAFLDEVLAECGVHRGSVVRIEAFLGDRRDHPIWDAKFRERWPQSPPARTTLSLDLVPAGVSFELQAVAVKGQES
ncbi:RidA family protein [Amycolatopsis pithecellobii]|uniref:RidA family protein n=1 Tax=Amycolatopsis pithecellobii TaxID=664692 RepID=A0A6N7Z4Z7_9PSEU|nr:RidA family protein [Amycolatopsis pithecellobii]MTD56579.1 hypothetical protein [Amycolatopsis pithecellobii]